MLFTLLHYMMYYVHYSMPLTNHGSRNGPIGRRQRLRCLVYIKKIIEQVRYSLVLIYVDYTVTVI